MLTSSTSLLPPPALCACRLELDCVHVELHKPFATCMEKDMAIQWLMKHISGTSKVYPVMSPMRRSHSSLAWHPPPSALSCGDFALCKLESLIPIMLGTVQMASILD